ncbi:hypothetical protein DL89DRAFT_269752 [Linderina pennispora]|uniref:Uncharacterized protein n=1 Tax=Linderina pennispora TaxID=61395 RepID=A0A1Y1W0Q2_9FUNG|nr:uncharacterized protein DL89DRAFT_269752 [Linderina pennispora]ORX66704.1 hypothetical protein DL89DRAFT_269752 [Linderina pennispora]
MQARLDHHLATSRERYIRVYRARMNRLLETGLFHPSDMQSIRAYLYTLETGEDDTPISHAPVAMRRDVEDALIHFKTKFAMPTEMVESSEFRAFCRAMFQAQRDGSLTTPFYTTPDAYMSRVGLTLYQRLANAERYSVLLGASSSGRYIGISVSVQQQRHFLGWAENSDITSVAAQRLEHGIHGVGAETKPVLFSIISAGPPWLSEIRQAAARAFLASHFIDSLASMLLDPAGQFAMHVTSLIEVAKAVIHSHDAHKRWISRKHQPITLPDPSIATSHLHMFQQMVSVDYEFLLQLKTIVSPESAAYFDNLLDRNMAPMFLALVQIFAVLDRAGSIASERNLSMSDLAVLFARMEKSLEVLAKGTHPSSTDDMQMLAKHVLAEFRTQLESEYSDVMLSMVLAHSLSFYPSDFSILEHRPNALAKGDSVGARIQHARAVCPACRHSATAWDVARTRHADDLPSYFAMSKMLSLAGMAPNRDMEPFATLSAALCECPVSATTIDVVNEDAVLMEIAHCHSMLVSAIDYNDAAAPVDQAEPAVSFGSSADVIATWQEPADTTVSAHSVLLCYFDAAQLAPLVQF